MNYKQPIVKTCTENADPTNEYVRDALSDGYLQIIILNRAIPHDVARWLRHRHNDYHSGAGTSWLEITDIA